jgi:2-polyprenyl-6-methoxyphenol hydroxylase-like FAD-dependent oxidoreductase
MHTHKADVAVLGGGPAGCVAARQLGQAGVDVILVDGAISTGSHLVESFPPTGAPLAEDVGLLSAICAASDGPASAMMMNWLVRPETRAFEGDGPLLLRREVLNRALRAEACMHARILQTHVRKIVASDDATEVTTDEGAIICRMIIDARGRRALKRPSSDLVALPFDARCDVPCYRMWLDALPDGWLWAASLENGQIHGAIFQNASAFSGLSPQDRLALARRQLRQASAFSNARNLSVGTPVAAGLSAVQDPITSPRHVLIGDAALARDPIASHGLVHALRSGIQAAVAVRTILDPTEDTQAAFAFLRQKHVEAVSSAREATARAYTDQSRFTGPFWAERSESTDAQTAPQIGSGPVTLADPLTRAPVLETDRIRWAPAITLPARGGFFTKFGTITARDIAAACRPAAPLQEIATRLGRVHAMPLVFDILQHLTLGGAFAQAAPLPSNKPRARVMSHPSSREIIRDSVS